MKERVLVVDDDADQCALLESMLNRLGYEATSTQDPKAALEKVKSTDYDAVLTDLTMDQMDGLALCEQVANAQPDLPVLVVTGQGSMERVIDAMRAGAYDFLVKPIDSKLLGLSIARATQLHKLRVEVKKLRDQAPATSTNGGILGSSSAMRRVNELIGRVGATDASVLIVGETGTGKELVARALHAASSRANGRFVAINCAAVPPTLLESELFGHAKGAFTDAKGDREGLFVQASGGTLFLDEIGEMPLEMQAKLLRALQEKVVRPVGANHEVAFDARILAATHRDLEADITGNRFRQDLYFRINVVRIDVPALRERDSDILQLATQFLTSAAARSPKGNLSLSPQVAERLMAYDWPGNVRELENCIEHAVALARFDHLTVEDLPAKVRNHRPERFSLPTESASEIVTLEELERRYIHRVIKLLDGNKSRVAQLLGLDRRTLYRKLEKYEAEKANQAAAQQQQPIQPSSSAPGGLA